jgi:phosphomannomutase
VPSENWNSIFKAYDVRGIYPIEINEEVACRIGEAYAAVRKPKKVAVGQDVRSSGKKLKEELMSALLKNGVDVVDIGVITTDQLYFAVGNYGFDGGISVTASHNPGEYNGFKFSESGGAPISSESLEAIRDWAASDKKILPNKKGSLTSIEIVDDYTNHVLSYINPKQIKPLDVLVKIKQTQPDFGVAWDADADRCFFFGGDGTFIPSCYIIAVLSQDFLRKYPASKIVHDTTTSWVIDDTIKKAGGTPITNRTGHTFMKARMRQEDAIFAGESSGHYYFKDSYYADNGIVPFLMVLEMVSISSQSLQQLVKPLMDKYKVSGEINFEVTSPAKAIELVEAEFGHQGKIDRTDGLVVNSNNWRFSVRPSNTEPLFRLNAEAYDQQVLDNLIKDISDLINT